MSSMTKIISGKKLFILSTIAVVVTGLALVATLHDAEAQGAKTGTFKFKCTESEGSFFDPGVTSPLVFSSGGHSNCTGLGPTSAATVTAFVGVGTTPNCILLTTGAAGTDAYGISKKGFITFSMALEQCFFDSTGSITVTPFEAFCGVIATNAFTSTVTGSYVMTGGVIDGSPVTGGTGTVSSAVDHCTVGSAPFANSVITTLSGTIILGP